MLQYLLAANSMIIIVGDFNYDLSKVPQNKFLDILKDHIQVVNKHIYLDL